MSWCQCYQNLTVKINPHFNTKASSLHNIPPRNSKLKPTKTILFIRRNFLRQVSVACQHRQSMFVIMFLQCFVLAVLALNVEGAMMNMSCPVVTPRELDWKALDGVWYLTAVATEDMVVQGDCATVNFDHQNTTDVSISWITNNTVTFYNGSVALIPDPNSNSTGDLLLVTYDDEKTETYSFLDVNYEHYAVVFACYNNDDGNSSTYEIWKLTRTPHLKDTDAVKLDQAIANYSLQDTQFFTFNNTEDTCRVNSGHQLDTSTLVMTSAAALALFRRFY